MGRSSSNRLVAVVAATALLVSACGIGGPTSAERPDDGSLDPLTETDPTPRPTAVPTPATTDYSIVAGDTLSGIAERFDVSVESLLEANAMTFDSVLKVDELMRIPLPPAPIETDDDTTVDLGNNRVLTDYTVATGDTLGSIAERFDTTVTELVDINEISIVGVLNVGDEVRVPVPSSSAAETAPEGPVAAPGTNRIEIDEYSVIVGDTLADIAARFGLTLGELFEANDLNTDSVLQVGQVLTIPGL